METFKQIIYRDSDTALMIIPTNQELQILPRFVCDLSKKDAQPLISLREFCLKKVDELEYVVYISEINRLDIQPKIGAVLCLDVSTLDDSEKTIIQNAGVKCTELLNS